MLSSNMVCHSDIIFQQTTEMINDVYYMIMIIIDVRQRRSSHRCHVEINTIYVAGAETNTAIEPSGRVYVVNVVNVVRDSGR